jgi:capsular exopolysaccharide synthesis family protein
LRDYKSVTGQMPQPIPTAQRVQGTSFFQMVVESTEFAYAQRYVIAWAEEFLKFKDGQRSAVIDKSATYYLQEIRKTELTLEKNQADITEFQKQNNIASVKEVGDGQQQRLDREQDEYMQKSKERMLLENTTKEKLASGMVEALPNKSEPPKPAGDKTGRDKSGSSGSDTSDPLAKFVDSRYNTLQAELKTRQDELERRTETLKDKHPYLIKLRQEIEVLQRQIQFQLDQIDARRVARIESLKQEETSYRLMIDELKKQVFQTRSIQQRYEQLKESETRTKSVLDDLRKKMDTINLTPSSEEQIAIVELGAGTPAPFGPKRAQMILMGLFMGLAAGLGIVYFLSRLDDRLELAEDVEAELEEPVLGQLPLIKPKDNTTVNLIITELDRHSMYAEALRGVRSAVLFGADRTPKHVMIVTSAMPGDGKTTFSVNFAATLALAGNRVLLIDSDLRRGNIHAFFGGAREPGFTEVLQGELHWSDAQQATSVNGLSIITTGQLPQNPGELLMSPVVSQFVAEAKAQYDYVIFDCPPLTSIDDTFSLVGFSDGLLFVVKSGQTSMRFARNALASVRQRGAHILGIVLNGITSDNPYYYYSHYYHAYYSQERSEAAAKSGGSQPARRMAAPQKRRLKLMSIDEEARVRAEKLHQSHLLASEDQHTADFFKRRRSALRGADKPSDSDGPPPPGEPPESV